MYIALRVIEYWKMKSKNDIVSLEIKGLIYVCEDDPKENLIIVYEDEGKSDYIKIQSISIPLKILHSWSQE